MRGPEVVNGVAWCVWCHTLREEWEMTMHQAGSCSRCVETVRAANLLLARAGLRATIRPVKDEAQAGNHAHE